MKELMSMVAEFVAANWSKVLLLVLSLLGPIITWLWLRRKHHKLVKEKAMGDDDVVIQRFAISEEGLEISTIGEDKITLGSLSRGNQAVKEIIVKGCSNPENPFFVANTQEMQEFVQNPILEIICRDYKEGARADAAKTAPTKKLWQYFVIMGPVPGARQKRYRAMVVEGLDLPAMASLVETGGPVFVPPQVRFLVKYLRRMAEECHKQINNPQEPLVVGVVGVREIDHCALARMASMKWLDGK